MDRNLDAFAKQLKFDIGLSQGLPRTEEGGYRVELQPDLKVDIFPFDGGLAFQAPVGKCAEEESSEELFVTLMHANLLGQGTGGALLSLDKKGQAVLLGDEVLGEVPYVEFRSRLEQFCNYAEYWQVMVNEWSQG